MPNRDRPSPTVWHSWSSSIQVCPEVPVVGFALETEERAVGFTFVESVERKYMGQVVELRRDLAEKRR